LKKLLKKEVKGDVCPSKLINVEKSFKHIAMATFLWHNFLITQLKGYKMLASKKELGISKKLNND
jgi:hypothetical protein